MLESERVLKELKDTQEKVTSLEQKYKDMLDLENRKHNAESRVKKLFGHIKDELETRDEELWWELIHYFTEKDFGYGKMLALDTIDKSIQMMKDRATGFLNTAKNLELVRDEIKELKK